MDFFILVLLAYVCNFIIQSTGMNFRNNVSGICCIEILIESKKYACKKSNRKKIRLLLRAISLVN